MINLCGQVAVVTGVLGRLGTVWAGALLDAGACVAGLDLRDGPCQVPETRRFVLIKADITSRAGLRDALAACQNALGPPSILVNNAGIDAPPSADGGSWRFGDIPDEISNGILEVNAHGTLRACQVFGSEMAKRGYGSIINIGSLYGVVAPDPRLYEHLPLDPPFLKPPAYSMSKAGVAALTRYLAALWGPNGIRVNTLTPGGVAGGQDPVFTEKFGARVPLRRMACHGDLTGPLLFLASDLSNYVNGVELVVDGGYSCW